ncbi:DUF4174 domain-containing protein [Sphingomonas sp.]|uniref:DUF4174 domain-containing protein n=1 Tax=Sphingomonas sp. TaxID=28214 RepID=UPI003AFFEA75
MIIQLVTPAAATSLVAVASATTIAAMKHHRRVLLVAAPSAADPRLARQRQQLNDWREGAAERDLTLVEVVGDHVEGAAEPASALRRNWRLPARDFQVVLIGKDGNAALRRAEPLSADTIRETIDAMPMRRAGLR